ncbi:MAG: TRAP transporter small permease subunit [Sneathiella sp.]
MFKGSVLSLALLLHQVTLRLCLLLLALVFGTQVTVVILRYLFGIGFVELHDLILYCYAGLCVLGLPVALRLDRHVRVDVFRPTGTSVVARRIDCVSYLILLAPFCLLTLWHVMPLVSYSWEIQEGSRETGGLPGYFIVMTALPVSCVLMLVQGLALFLDKSLIHTSEAR